MTIVIILESRNKLFLAIGKSLRFLLFLSKMCFSLNPLWVQFSEHLYLVNRPKSGIPESMRKRRNRTDNSHWFVMALNLLLCY